MIIVYKDFAPGRTNMDSINAHEAFVRNQIQLGTLRPLFTKEPERGCMLVDPDKWDDFVEAVNINNSEMNEMEAAIEDLDEAEDEETYEADANYITDVKVIDPDSKLEVTLAVFKDTRTGGMLAIDASFLDHDDTDTVPSPFHDDVILRLKGLG